MYVCVHACVCVHAVVNEGCTVISAFFSDKGWEGGVDSQQTLQPV